MSRRRRPRRCTGLYTCQCKRCADQRAHDSEHRKVKRVFPWENELDERDGLRARRYRS